MATALILATFAMLILIMVIMMLQIVVMLTLMRKAMRKNRWDCDGYGEALHWV